MDAERMDALTLAAWLRNASAAVRPASLPVLLAIVDDALTAADGVARVSIATLAAETLASANTAQRAIADLCGAGVIRREDARPGRLPGYALGVVSGEFAGNAGPRRKDPLIQNEGGSIIGVPQNWPTPKTTKTHPKNDVLATFSAPETKDIESTCLPAKQEGRGAPKLAPHADQTGEGGQVWTVAPPGEAGQVWETLAMANVGNPARSELCFRLTLKQAREVIAAARDRNKLPWQIVLDLRERATAEHLRAEHRARIEAHRAKSQATAANVLATKQADAAAEREALAAALVTIDAATPAALEAATREALAAKGEHIAAMVTKRGTVAPADAARHPRIAVDVARLLSERSGRHIASVEHTA